MNDICKFLPQLIQLTIYYRPSINVIDNSKNKKHIRVNCSLHHLN